MTTIGSAAWGILYAEAEGSLRQRAEALTQAFAYELEALIAATPEQWHVLSPIWPASASTSAPSH
ncbi:MAG: hypothetical protein R2706_13100 [Acidimicrobiales bacterium]